MEIKALETAILRALSRSEKVDLASGDFRTVGPCVSSCVNYKSVNFSLGVVEQSPNYMRCLKKQ